MFSEAPRLVRASYFLPAEEKLFLAILYMYYTIQLNKSQSQNKIDSDN